MIIMGIEELTRFQMVRDGFTDTSEDALNLYSLIGKKHYYTVLESAFEYACIEAQWKGLDTASPEFNKHCKQATKTTVHYMLQTCIDLKTEGYDLNSCFQSLVMDKREMWEHIKSKY